MKKGAKPPEERRKEMSYLYPEMRIIILKLRVLEI